MAIQSFVDHDTKIFFETGRAGKVGWINLRVIAKRKLDMLHYASRLIDLRVPPGNKLEALSGELTGKYSIRINDQWRIVFRWTSFGPTEVKITDYH